MPESFYEYKIQELLMAAVFGMKPASKWVGNYEVLGGIIVVKQNGKLACYHIRDRDQFKKYLYLNTRFDTPCLTKHDFGRLYSKDGSRFIKLKSSD